MTETKNSEAPTGARLDYRAAAVHSGLGRTTLTGLVTSGAIPAAKIGRAVRISRQGLDEYMRRNAYLRARSRLRTKKSRRGRTRA